MNALTKDAKENRSNEKKKSLQYLRRRTQGKEKEIKDRSGGQWKIHGQKLTME